jgi:hypothetical protein
VTLSSRSVASLVGILLLLAAFACFAQSQPSSAEKTVDLKTLQDSYAKSIQKVDGDNTSAAQNLLATYVKEVQKIQQTVQKAGDLDGLTAVNRELERFKTEQTVPDEPDASTPDAIKKVQFGYKTAVAKNNLENNRKIVSVTKQYLERLNSLQMNLTKSGKVDEALDVNAEVKRVQGDGKFTSAEFAVAAAETEKQPAKKDNQPPEKQPPADQAKKTPNTETSDKTGKAKTAADSSDTEATIYDGKPFPDALGKNNYKDMRLVGSDRITGTPKISITAALATENNMQSSSSSYWGGVERTKHGSMAYQLRLILKSAIKTYSVDDPTLVVQYFSKNVVTSGKSNPALIEAKKFTLPRLDGTRNVGVDLPPVSLESSSYRNTDGYWGNSESSASGRELYGFIVSIFDSSGALVAQSGSNNTLRKLGVNKVP